VQELLASEENHHFSSKATKHKAIVLATGGRKTSGEDEEAIDVGVDATQLDSPEWHSRCLVLTHTFPALGGDVDGSTLVYPSTAVEGGGDMLLRRASVGGIVALHQANWSSIAANEYVITVHVPPKNQALLPTCNILQGAIVNSVQKRPSEKVE
jgi:hypothetical protein